jgi:hypothetical protein
MNLSSDTTYTPLAPLESQETLTFEDIVPLLRITSSSFGKILFTTEELASTKKDGEIVPTKLDILCGRDKVSYGHVGNKRFRVIVSMNRERYQSCSSREAKTRITDEIIKDVRECGGRFLKLNEQTNTYEDVGDEIAHEKVSHALRSAKDPKKRAPPKKRKIVRKPPTPQENRAFAFMYTEQQRIFQELLAEQQASMSMRQQWQRQMIVGV